MTTDVINGVLRDEFQREERYVVVKISKMHPHPEFRRRHLEALKAENIAALVDCVVVEKDWPEYETVWKMIEARVSGATAQPAADGEREAICCEHSWKVAKDEAWAARSFNECKCDHNEYCDHCFPPDFRKGGKWHAGYQPRAAQPQQAVAVTDASTLKIALAELHKCGVKPGSLPHMVLTNLIDAAHKTGEEE